MEENRTYIRCEVQQRLSADRPQHAPGRDLTVGEPAWPRWLTTLLLLQLFIDTIPKMQQLYYIIIISPT